MYSSVNEIVSQNKVPCAHHQGIALSSACVQMLQVFLNPFMEGNSYFSKLKRYYFIYLDKDSKHVSRLCQIPVELGTDDP